jgi:4-hydroxybenzoyl-CoA thioesterase
MVRFHHCDPAGIVLPALFYLLRCRKTFAHIGLNMSSSAVASASPSWTSKPSFGHVPQRGPTVASLELTKIGNASLGMQYEISALSKRPTTTPVRLRAHGIVVYSRCRMAKRFASRTTWRGADALPGSTDMMQRIQPPRLGRTSGYANGILARAQLYIGGQIG